MRMVQSALPQLSSSSITSTIVFLVHHDKLYLKRHTRGGVLVREGFIVSPKTVLNPTTQWVFLEKPVGLLGRVIWSHRVAHLHLTSVCGLDPVGGLAVVEPPHASIFLGLALVGLAARVGGRATRLLRARIVG